MPELEFRAAIQGHYKVLSAPAAPPQPANVGRQPAPAAYVPSPEERTYAPQPQAIARTEKTPARNEESYSDQADREVANLIKEIMQYNDQQAVDDSQRWLINQSTLKQLTTRNQNIIKRVLEGEMAAELQAHHDHYGLHGRMANRGKDIDELENCARYH